MKKLLTIAVAILVLAPTLIGCRKWNDVWGAASSGETGSLQWKLHKKTGVLAINGNGEMPDYSWAPFMGSPWRASNDKIKKIIIGEGVTTIGNFAFSNCTNLTGVTIPASMSEIGMRNCPTLTSITVLATVPPTISTDFDFQVEDDILYVPVGYVEAYKTHETWSAAFADIVEIR